VRIYRCNRHGTRFSHSGGTTTAVKMRGFDSRERRRGLCDVRPYRVPGLSRRPQFMLLPHLRSGKLIEVVLPEWKTRPMPIAAVSAQSPPCAQGSRVC